MSARGWVRLLSANLLTGRPYRVVMRLLAVLLGFLSVLLFQEGLSYLLVRA